MANKLYKSRLEHRYLTDYGECITFFMQNGFKDTTKYISGLASYLFSVNKSYDTLKRSKNTLGCIHFVRMAADVCCFAFGLLYLDTDAARKRYIKHCLDGEPLNKFQYFVEEGGKKVKHQYSTNFLAAKITEQLYEGFAEIYTISNQYIHPTSFYANSVDWANYEVPNTYASFAAITKQDVEMDDKVALEYYHLMQDLNGLFFQIIRYIMGKYERAYLWERMQQFPLQITNIEVGVQPKGKGKVEYVYTFSTNLQLVWDMLTQYEKAPNKMLDQIRHIITSGSLKPSEIIQLNITNEILKNASNYKAQIEEFIAQKVDLEAAGIEHKVTKTQMGKGNLLYLDWLFPNKKVRKKLTPSTGTTNEGL